MMNQKNIVSVCVGVIGVVIVAKAGMWGVDAFRAHRALIRASAQMQRGFSALAVDTLEPYRRTLAKKENGCSALVNTYFQAKRPDLLEWATQACLDAGRESPEIFIGLAASRELTGRDQEAVQILSQVANKYDKIPDIYYRIAQILRRNKRNQEAVVAYAKTIERAPDNAQIALEALQFFSDLQRWPEAKAVADRLRNVQIGNPEVKLVIARAYFHAGDKASAQALTNQAKELVAKRPEIKAALEKGYPELFGERATASTKNHGD